MPLANVAIIGSGNIGTDLLVKIVRRSSALNVAALVGIDPQSDGLARARSLGVPTTAEGLAGLLAMPEFETIDIVMDATSAGAHRAHAAALAPYEKRLIDLTPAALGPFVVPAVNLHEQRAATNINMVTCGGQATIPIVAAVARVVAVRYAEIVASVASRSAGPGTRANIDEFTDTTARALESVGGADRAKAIIILNPADPPLIMRDTILCLTDDVDHEAVRASIHAMIADVAQYVPGYRLKQDIQIAPLDGVEVHTLVDSGAPLPKWKISTFLEVEGAADYLPNYAGNLDIMTSAAVRAAEEMTAAVTTEASA